MTDNKNIHSCKQEKNFISIFTFIGETRQAIENIKEALVNINNSLDELFKCNRNLTEQIIKKSTNGNGSKLKVNLRDVGIAIGAMIVTIIIGILTYFGVK